MMTQNEKWHKNLEAVLGFMDAHHRNPSKHKVEEHLMLNWIKYQRKLLNHGLLQSDRLEKFKSLLAKAEKLRRLNQWV